jgi:hypothetical protein
MARAKLKLARGMVLEFSVDWVKHGLNPVQEERKKIHSFRIYFQA